MITDLLTAFENIRVSKTQCFRKRTSDFLQPHITLLTLQFLLHRSPPQELGDVPQLHQGNGHLLRSCMSIDDTQQ